jgi:hypothetical protein
MSENGDYKSYARYFKESWNELETRFRNGEVNPNQENDVVCFLYYALAKRLKNKRRKEGKDWFTFDQIKTEDSISLRNERCRVDINLADRLFIEVKIWSLRDFGIQNLMRKKEIIAFYMDRLAKYSRYAEKKYPNSYQRKSVLAIWFRNRKADDFNDKLVNERLSDFFESQKRKFREKATIYYGPKLR